jgi:chemotaxis protein CheC
MKNSLEDYKDILEDLKEVGNIGSGYAASRLSELINKRCFVNMPEAGIYNVSKIKEKFFPHNVFAVAIFLKVLGDINALMVVIMNKSDTQRLIDIIDPIHKREQNLSTTYLSSYTLKNFGELLTNSFNTAISQFMNLKLKQSLPEIIIDTWSNVLDKILDDISQSDPEQIVIFSRFYNDEIPFEGRFFYMISSDNAQKILKTIGEI